jgi:diguanylate cyclase (GGDEF)-like protein
MRILFVGKQIAGSPEIKIVLETKGYQLIIRDELHSAISLFLDDPPDMLVMEKGFDNNKGSDTDLLNSVKACQQKVNIPVILAVSPEDIKRGIDWETYPVDDFFTLPPVPDIVVNRIELALARMARVFDNNPLSKLPGNTSILQAIQHSIESEEKYAVCYSDIDNFKPYNDRYGFSQGDDVILMVARITVNAVDELARKDSFIGHVGGDDFVFIVREEKTQAVCERILDNFEVVKKMFLSSDDLEAGCYVEKDRQGRETTFGLLSLSIAVVLTETNKYTHSGEVATVAAQIKHYVKEKEGSNYLIDRRAYQCN